MNDLDLALKDLEWLIERLGVAGLDGATIQAVLLIVCERLRDEIDRQAETNQPAQQKLNKNSTSLE